MRVHTGSTDEDDEQRQGLLLTLLAQAQRDGARMDQQSRYILEAVRTAASAKIGSANPGTDGVAFAHEVADSVLHAVFKAMRDGPPAGA